MKRISLIGILLGIAIVPAAWAATITGSQTPNASFLDGGEITAVTTPPVLLGMPGPGGPPSFQTFCIESQITFHNGGTYNYTVSATDHAGHPLTWGAAWLFAQFTAGTLPGYDYTFGSGRMNSAGALQAAIWDLQLQTVPSGFGVLSVQTGIDLGLANTAAIAAGHLASDPANGAFNVDILSLSDANGAPVQDWLAVPDSSTTIALLGFVLVGIESVRRKFAC